MGVKDGVKGVFRDSMESDVVRKVGEFKSSFNREERVNAIPFLLKAVIAGKDDVDTKIARETLANGITPQDVREMPMRSQVHDSTMAQFKVLGAICKPDAVREMVKIAEEKGENGVADSIRNARPEVWPKLIE